MSLLRSFSVRLAAIYFLLFSVSLALVLGTYQVVSINIPRDAVKDALRAESDAFASSWHGDARALARALEARAGAPAPRAGFHLLSGPRGEVVTTNLPSWPRFSDAEWHSIEADIYRDGDEDDREALVFDRRLADGSRLLVGRDVEDLDDIEEAIAAAAQHLVVATLILAILGALLMNWAIGRRLARVSNAARRVMGGDLAGRVPLDGSGDDFDRLAATLNLMLDRVESGVEAVRIVSDHVAHELRTPVTRLQASLRRAAEAGHPPAPPLAEALEEADRLQSMFDSVLRISRIESGRHAPAAGPVDLSALAADAADLYRPAAEEAGVSLDLDVASGLRVAGDRDLLFQALANVLDNAIKFTPAGGSVTVRAAREADRIALAVDDTGPGVPGKLIARLGERFFRAPAAAGRPGFGLGLSLAAAIARLHGAALRFANRDPGLVVTLSLPPAP
jgi:signal transduction histidine kinase